MNNYEETMSVNRQYKSKIFAMLYQDKKELLSLYNAVNGTNYKDPEQLEINTLENAIYMSMHNDISFVIGCNVSLYEHQSTFSPNLPLRFLFYMSDLYSKMTKDENLYGTKKVEIPAPKFIIFYNGVEKRPERETLRLSDMYYSREEHSELELEATLLNINIGYNEEIKSICKSLKDYAEYTGRVRTYAKEMRIEEAVEKAITECIREGILAEFLSKNRAEAKKMSIYEYDEEKHMRMEREASYADGKLNGIEQGKKGLLKEQITKKLAKGKSVEVIADELEEDVPAIQVIIDELNNEK